jgi:hypothetical protein
MEDPPVTPLPRLYALAALLTLGCGGVPGVPASATSPAANGADAITNTQEAGVDEGDIVKARGRHLLVLRRGRLFSIDAGGPALRARDRIDVPGPGRRGGWYDEMLVHGDTVVVLGYDYRQGASEVAMFHLADDGGLSRRGAFFLRSADYYSSRNYASRRIGDRLVFYMPYPTHLGPALRTLGSPWAPIEVRRSAALEGADHSVLHTVITCDLGRPGSGCSAEGVLGGWGRSFYVSPTSVYVWVSEGRTGSVVYRLPLASAAPATGIRASGMPIDPFSFSEHEGRLDVLVQAWGRGDAMWGPEVSHGDVALMQVPLAAFDEHGGRPELRPRYTTLPRLPGHGLQNRFVGDRLLYGVGERLVVVPTGGGRVDTLDLGHRVERIDRLGRDAVVLGNRGRDLLFTSLALTEGPPRMADRFIQPAAAQSERRSHGFFFSEDGPGRGALGLPVHQRGGAGVLFLEVQDLRFHALGRLDSAQGHVDDRCLSSCVDWYGNARPIFWRGRVFALLGYELVEGRRLGGRLVETQRLDFLRGRTRLAEVGEATVPRTVRIPLAVW